jgi:hypothetical protein
VPPAGGGGRQLPESQILSVSQQSESSTHPSTLGGMQVEHMVGTVPNRRLLFTGSWVQNGASTQHSPLNVQASFATLHCKKKKERGC